MIAGAGFASFPEIPKGSPGAIDGAADRLSRAGDHMHDVAGGLRATVDGLGQDWTGDAAGRYRLAAHGLADVARAAAATYRECAGCVRDYGRALEDAQQTLRQLRGAYEEAVRRASTTSGTITSLTAQMAAPDAPDHLASDLLAAQSAHDAAVGDAGRILRRAHAALDDFHRSERHAIGTLSGQRVGPAGGLGSPFGGGPGVGSGIDTPGFGIPLGGLAPFDGVVRVNDPWNSDVPGLGTYWDGTHPSAEPVDDLTNAVMLAAGGVGAIGLDTLRFAAREVITSGLRRAGLVGSRTVAREAYGEGFDEALGFGRGGAERARPFRTRLQEARSAGEQSRAKALVGLRAARARTLKSLVNGLRRAGVKVPEGTGEVLADLYEHSAEYKYKVLFKLWQLRDRFASRGPAGAAIARAIDRLTGLTR